MNELQEKEMLENTKEDTNRENPVKEFFSWLLYVAGVILLTFLFITFVAQKTEVSGRSMLNTLHDRDSLIVSA